MEVGCCLEEARIGVSVLVSGCGRRKACFFLAFHHSLIDPDWLQLVVLIVEEGEVTSGVILNRPSIASVGDLFDRAKVLS